MIRVHDFRCENGHVSEHFVNHDEIAWLSCPVCGTLAQRIVSAPRIKLDAISGHFPSATRAWELRREEKMAIERKTKANHGTYGDGSWERGRKVTN